MFECFLFVEIVILEFVFSCLAEQFEQSADAVDDQLVGRPLVMVVSIGPDDWQVAKRADLDLWERRLSGFADG